MFADSNKVVALELEAGVVRVRQGEEDREALLAALVCRMLETTLWCHPDQGAVSTGCTLCLACWGEGGGVARQHEPATEDGNAQEVKEDQIDVLLATDVAARGLDIRGEDCHNYTMPTTGALHPQGWRTARAGQAGLVSNRGGRRGRW